MVEAYIQHCHPCQVVSMSQEREQLRMTPMPSKPWKEVAVDFWGPINTGEYLLVTVCKQSRWAEWSIIFIPPSSRVLMAESLVILSFPFHKKLKIIWFTCFIMFDGVVSNEDT